MYGILGKMRTWSLLAAIGALCVLCGCSDEMAWPEGDMLSGLLGTAKKPAEATPAQAAKPVANPAAKPAPVVRPVSKLAPVVRPVAQAAPPVVPITSGGANYLASHDASDPTAEKTPGAVREAMSLMRRLNAKNEELVKANKISESLRDENRLLTKQLAGLRLENAQLETELREANDELIAAAKSLEQWKAQIIGKQERIDKAHAAQMKALFQILRVLGAETPTVAKAAKTPVKDSKGTTSVPK